MSVSSDRAGLVVVVNGNGHGRDMRAEAFRDIKRIHLARLRQQDRELLSAEPPGEVVDTQLVAQRIGDGPQCLVSHQMAVGVVDQLEVIDVDQRER
jgi:hypothetical protein